MSGINSAQSILGIAGSFIGITTISVALRFVARRRQSQDLGLDDWAMLAALLCFYAYAGVTIGQVYLGTVGHGFYPFPASEWPHKWLTYDELITTSAVASTLGYALTKISALALYKRIFCGNSTSNRVLYWLIVGTSAIIACWAVTFCFFAGFQCKGTKDDYIPSEHAKNCAKYGNIYTYGVFLSDLILDIWVIILPIPNIASLRMSLKRKISVSAVFLLALVGVAASAVRFAEFLKVAVYKTKFSDAAHEEDFNSTVAFYIILEMGMMIVSINIPVTATLVLQVGPELIMKWAQSVTSLASRSPRGTNRSGSEATHAGNGKPAQDAPVELLPISHRQHQYHADITGEPGKADNVAQRIKVESSVEVSSTQVEEV